MTVTWVWKDLFVKMSFALSENNTKKLKKKTLIDSQRLITVYTRHGE